jgi:hypothetical protein
MGVPVKETAADAHLDDRNLTLLLQPADVAGHHVQQLALADLVQVPQLRQQVRSPVQQLRRLRPAPAGDRHERITRGPRHRPQDDQALAHQGSDRGFRRGRGHGDIRRQIGERVPVPTLTEQEQQLLLRERTLQPGGRIVGGEVHGDGHPGQTGGQPMR